MTTRTVIDPSQAWMMRVSTPGKDVLTGGGPYLFDGSLETLQVHQSGILPNVFVTGEGNIGSLNVFRAIGPEPYAGGRTVTFPALPYIPHVEWAITSPAVGNYIDYPTCQRVQTIEDPNYWIIDLPVSINVTTSSVEFIATTNGAYYKYDLSHSNQQGTIFYTVFKRPAA